MGQRDRAQYEKKREEETEDFNAYVEQWKLWSREQSHVWILLGKISDRDRERSRVFFFFDPSFEIKGGSDRRSMNWGMIAVKKLAGKRSCGVGKVGVGVVRCRNRICFPHQRRKRFCGYRRRWQRRNRCRSRRKKSPENTVTMVENHFWNHHRERRVVGGGRRRSLAIGKMKSWSPGTVTEAINQETRVSGQKSRTRMTTARKLSLTGVRRDEAASSVGLYRGLADSNHRWESPERTAKGCAGGASSSMFSSHRKRDFSSKKRGGEEDCS